MRASSSSEEFFMKALVTQLLTNQWYIFIRFPILLLSVDLWTACKRQQSCLVLPKRWDDGLMKPMPQEVIFNTDSPAKTQDVFTQLYACYWFTEAIYWQWEADLHTPCVRIHLLPTETNCFYCLQSGQYQAARHNSAKGVLFQSV